MNHHADENTDMSAEPENTRRVFLGQCGGALQALLLAGVAGPLIQACETSQVIAPRGRDASTIAINVSSLAVDGAFLVSSEPGPDGKAMLVVRKSAATYLVMSMECTHQQCQVPAPSNNVMTCPCHQSQFGMEGEVIRTPAPAPLKRYANTYDATRSLVTVSF